MTRLPALLVALLAPAAALNPGSLLQSELVIHKKGTKEYHRPGCPVVRDGGDDLVALTRAQAESRGLSAHAACDPDVAPPPGADAKPAPPRQVFVYVDDGRYYHRETCSRLGKDAKKVSLEDAGKKYWPCPVCKPPIRQRPRERGPSRSGHAIDEPAPLVGGLGHDGCAEEIRVAL